MPEDRIVVLCSLFPSEKAPFAGLFIRERMFRVAKHLPLIVIAPQPWSPLDFLIRVWRPAFRPRACHYTVMNGIGVYRPTYLSFPGIGKRFDGWLMYRSIDRLLARIRGSINPVLVDAHFLYPDGYAASLVATRLGIPLTVTIRGSKDQRLMGTSREFGLRAAIGMAHTVITVSAKLKEAVALPLGADADRTFVVGNGVDTGTFYPEDQAVARKRLGLPEDAQILVTVGALTRLKGFHRIVKLLPTLVSRWPNLHYLIVGGHAGHADMVAELEQMVAELGLQNRVHFCGPQSPDELRWYYSAADLFVLATEYEGWANVLLESIACGTPVVTTDVGGNAQVVPRDELGFLCPYWDEARFRQAIHDGLSRDWERDVLLEYAAQNSWDARIPILTLLLKDAIAKHKTIA